MRIQFAIILLFQTICMAGTIKGQTMNDTRISLNARKITLQAAFDEIEQKTNFSIGYNAKEIDVQEKVNIQATNEPVVVILKKLLKDYVGDISQVNDQHIFLKVTRIHPTPQPTPLPDAPVVTISGTVIDETGQPLPGVSVTEKGW